MRYFVLLFLISLSLFAKTVYFGGGKMSLDELATIVNVETNKNIIISQSLKKKYVTLMVSKTVNVKKIFFYFKQLIEANGLALNKKNGFYVVSPITDLKFYSHSFKYKKASDFKVYLENYKNSCSLGKKILFCNLVPKKYNIVSKMVKLFDVPTSAYIYKNKSVHVDLKILQSDYNDLLSLQSSLTSEINSDSVKSTFSANNSLKFALGLFLHGANITDTSSLNFVFNFLQKNGYTNVVNEPNILVTNNYKTTILAGAVQRVIASTSKNSDLSTTTNTFEDFQSGLTFSVTPHIIDDNTTKLDIDFRNSQIIGGSAQLPSTSNQSYKTSIIIKKNHTIVLGGVLFTKQTNEKYKIPFLGDIPIIGVPFNGSSVSNTREVLTIFLSLKD